jgi:cytochrome d ubiquinol oxidase subunit I
MKLAALEAMWRTEEAPAGLTVFGVPSLEDRQTHHELKVPYVLGLISTRSVNGEVMGILELVAVAEDRIESGVVACDALEKIKADPTDAVNRGVFETHRNDLGYGLLLKRYMADPRAATPEQITVAAWSTVPNVPLMFWSFRIMAGIGFAMIALFATAFILFTLRKHETRWFLRFAVLAIPLPWLAAEFGWLVAEVGRQPWAVEGVLPTFLGASSLTAPQLWATLIGFTLFYGVLAVIEVGLILHLVRKGPFAEQEAFAPRPAVPGAPPSGARTALV